jgi:DNA ligase (NAD+)
MIQPLVKKSVKRYNEEFITLLEKLSTIMMNQNETFKSRAYLKAQETILAYPKDITCPATQLKGQPGIGAAIMDKLVEYVETGTLALIEREKHNPVNIFCDIYGVGPKKAQELVAAGIYSIDVLRSRQNEVLNETQKVGLKYYEDIIDKVPRKEIIAYETLFTNVFKSLMDKDTNTHTDTNTSTFEIVGSYRRGAESSGDIDVIITGQRADIYTSFVSELYKKRIILEILSKGPCKTLVITRLGEGYKCRRVDFLYAPPNEYAFALLYFTGSKVFNTMMRQHAVNRGYTFNEHGIYRIEDNKKGAKVRDTHTNNDKVFLCEKDIFDFLELEYRSPGERKDGRLSVKTRVLEKHEFPIIRDFQTRGITVLDTLTETELQAILLYTNDMYFNHCPVLTDSEYDIMKDYVLNRFPSGKHEEVVGSEPTGNNKCALPYEMYSMNKIKPDTNALLKWTQEYSGPYIVSCKLDGVSGLYVSQGEKRELYTRGNGKIGQNVSHLIPYLTQGLPFFKEKTVIRGEFIIPKKVFAEKYQNQFANPRNMVAGLINQKKSNMNSAIADVHFVAYEVIVPALKPSEQMRFIQQLSIRGAFYKEFPSLSNELLSRLLVECRSKYVYEIDGIVVTNDCIYPRKPGNPEHAFAFKMVLMEQIAEAKVVDVLWTPSKDGYLKPRVQIEPIRLGGVMIEYATGFNAAFIRDNKIGVGAIIELIRSGDVIPHIRSVLTPSVEAKMPNDVKYVWNDTGVDILLANKEEDATVKEKNITGFFKGIKVDGMSSGIVNKLIRNGYDSVPKILALKEADLLKMDGFKDRLSSKIVEGIRARIQEASLVELMAASNIFGRGFSEKRIECILEVFPDIVLSGDSMESKRLKVETVNGMAEKTAALFVDKIEDFRIFMDKCGLTSKYQVHQIDTNTNTNTNTDTHLHNNHQHPLFGKTVVMTGTRNKEIIAFLKKMGIKNGTSVSKNTAMVITKSKEDATTSKLEEAQKLGIKVVLEKEFMDTYMIIN